MLALVESVYTVTEVARLLRQIEGASALSARAIRYYDRCGMVSPSGGRLKKSKTSRAARLYTTIDIALLRLVCRLRRKGVHERAAWGLLVYRGDELRRLLAQGHGDLIVETPAALAIGSEDRSTPKPIRIDVTSLLSGLAERLTAYRRRNPEVWTGLAWIPAMEAMARRVSA